MQCRRVNLVKEAKLSLRTASTLHAAERPHLTWRKQRYRLSAPPNPSLIS